jgi:hypothetical protein
MKLGSGIDPNAPATNNATSNPANAAKTAEPLKWGQIACGAAGGALLAGAGVVVYNKMNAGKA